LNQPSFNTKAEEKREANMSHYDEPLGVEPSMPPPQEPMSAPPGMDMTGPPPGDGAPTSAFQMEIDALGQAKPMITLCGQRVAMDTFKKIVVAAL
jgi:hypothetical protein